MACDLEAQRFIELQLSVGIRQGGEVGIRGEYD